SSSLLRLRPGTRVFAEGPYGALTANRRRRRKVLLIAGGIGITPLRALFESLPGAPGDVTLIYRASRPQDLVLLAELDQIAAARGARVHYLVGGRRSGLRDRLSAEHLNRLVPRLAEHDVYVCGPHELTDTLRGELRRAGVPRGNIHTESFAF
ncbi:MAG TPA: hypothetical protein VFU35_15285, partial [Jatrophihabitans sp.]|nr:hypothetical protein [Jatrophihabitans sp.]